MLSVPYSNSVTRRSGPVMRSTAPLPKSPMSAGMAKLARWATTPVVVCVAAGAGRSEAGIGSGARVKMRPSHPLGELQPMSRLLR